MGDEADTKTEEVPKETFVVHSGDDVKKSTRFRDRFQQWTSQKHFLRGGLALQTEKETLEWALWALRFAVLADAVSGTILEPNYPFLVTAGAHPDSFDSTSPFGFSAANYFLPMSTLLGAAITSAFVGNLSDRIGRRPCILACVGVSVGGSIVKWIARKSFWGYCGASFFNGLFAGTLPVAMAYVSDVRPKRAEKDQEIGLLVGANMIGRSGGGIVAILLEDQGLFAPLWFGAAINFMATIFAYVYLLEPHKSFHFDDVEEEEEDAPDHINIPVFLNVNIGALFDNIGSVGVSALSLSPLMFNTWLQDFVVRGEEPVMSEVGFKWIAVMLAIMVIPGAALSTPLFDAYGPAFGCVLGNLITACGIVTNLYIARIEPPTSASWAGFICALYSIFPFTVLSQLSTGPMLDQLSPPERRGFAQGINITIMNFAMAISPYALGTFSDEYGISTCLWLCVGISLLAAVSNVPLMFSPALKRKAKPDFQQPLEYEDADVIDKIHKGEWVPLRYVEQLNYARLLSGLPMLSQSVRTFEEDKNRLAELHVHALEDFEYIRNRHVFYLNEILDPERKKFLLEQLKKSLPPEEENAKHAAELGTWFGEYLLANGYFLDGGSPTLQKQIIMCAFPPINTDGEINETNSEQSLIRMIALLNSYLDRGQLSSATKAFAGSVVK